VYKNVLAELAVRTKLRDTVEDALLEHGDRGLVAAHATKHERQLEEALVVDGRAHCREPCLELGTVEVDPTHGVWGALEQSLEVRRKGGAHAVLVG
jgi:hypothetical protein